MSSSSPIFQVGTRIDRYTVLQKPGGGNETVAHPLGIGGTSHVFLVEQELVTGKSIKRALKLFSPTAEVKSKRGQVGETYGSHHFLDEIDAISRITHQNIVKIIDAGMHGEAPFYVMEYIEGADLQRLLAGDDGDQVASRFVEAARRDPYVVLRMAQQICWPLTYLHARRRFHFDLAPKNVFVRWVDGRPHLQIGDLGVSRDVPREADATDKEQTMFIAGTKEYTPPDIEPYRSENRIPVHELARLAPHWDLFALSKIVLQMVERCGPGVKELQALRILCERIMDDPKATAEEVASDLDRLLPAHVLTAGVEELATDAYGERHYISIPLNPVPMSKRAKALVDHPTLTRLQLVPQLLLYRSANPGGVHTVFEHLLGSYGIALKCINKLLSQPRFRAEFPRKRLEEALLAVVLSRLDKYPLDRIVSQVEPYKPNGRRENLEEILSHAADGRPPLRDMIQKQFPQADLSSVIEILCDPVDTLAPYQKLISSLLESSLNVRAMDYLVRDSLHTGLKAGAGVDIDSIIDSLRWSSGSDGIGLTRAGVFSFEHLLCARYWMFARLYWNHPNRAVTAMLRHVVHAILKKQVDRGLLSHALMATDESGALNQLNSLYKLTEGFGKTESNIIELLQKPRPRRYEHLLDKFAKNWAGRDIERGRLAIAACSALSLDEMEALKAEFWASSSMRSQDPSLLLFDVTRIEHKYRLGEDILVTMDDEELPLAGVSDIVAMLPQIFHDTCIRFRAFIHPDVERQASAGLRDELSAFIDARFLP